MKELIKNILIEETDSSKLKLVKSLIYQLFDNISFIEQSTYDNKPLLKVYFDSDDPAANIESWFDEHISDKILEYTGGNVVVCPYWIFSWDWRRKAADVYIDTELLKYDEEGNVLNEEYSPAGKEITPNEIVVHKSNPIFRDKILEQGLRARAGECYRIYAGYGEKCIPAIFATNTTNKRAWFDSTYDDDVWFINTTKIPDVKWFKDRHYESKSKHIVTFRDIPKEAITLKYEGTGSSEDVLKSWPEDSPNRLEESSIKEHPRQEEFNKYKDNIDNIVYSVVSKEELCGYRTEFFINSGEDALRIVLYYKDGLYPGYEKHTENVNEIKFMLENYLPIVDKAFVAFDSTFCKKRMVESVDEVETNLKVINLMIKQLNWKGLCDIWVEYNDKDGDYEIRSKSTERFFDHDEIVNELGYLENTLRSMGIRPYIFTPWYVEECEDKVEFLNESKEQTNYIEILKELVEPFKEDECVCDIYTRYDDIDDMYSVYLVFGTEELNDKYTSDGKYLYISKKQKEVRETIKNYLPIQNVFVGSLGKPHCGWKRMNESDESKQERKFTKLLNNIEEYLNSNSYDSVVRFMVDYDEVRDDVIVNIFFDFEESVRLGLGINPVIKKTGKKIMEDLNIFPFDFKYYVHFDKPKLNESKKNSTEQLITKVLNTLVLPQYKHVICGFELKNVDDKSLNNAINYPGIVVTFIGGYGTKMWPRTQAVQKMHDDLLDEVWDTVWDYTGIAVELYTNYVKTC
jgi:hypothetical protein